jgi:hypothetical protein
VSVTIERVGYLLLFDGIDVTFVTTEDIDDAYVTTIGEFVTAYPGLQIPRSLTSAIDLGTGLLADTSATFTIEDVDDTLAALFGSSQEDAGELLTELEPGDTALSTEWGKHVGVELIGPAGERRQCSCVPGWNVGMHHFSTSQSFAFGLGQTPVSDSPVVWPGRRCALYRLVQQADGSWPDLMVEANREAALCWFGTCLGQGTQEQRVWSIKCAGPESWTTGNLGVGLPKEPLPVEAMITIDEAKGEHRLFASLRIVELDDYDNITPHYWYVDPDTYEDDSLLSGALSYSDVAAALNTFLDNVANDTSNGTELAAAGASSLRFSTSAGLDGIQVRWNRDEDTHVDPGDSNRLVLELTVSASLKVWQVLGYEPAVQNRERDPVEHEDQFGDFKSGSAAQIPGFWTGHFYSANAKAMRALLDDFPADPPTVRSDYTNNQVERRWPPIYPGGCQVFEMDGAGQEFRLKTQDPLFLLGSKAFPPMADPDDPSSPFSISGDVGPVNAVGLMAFRGPYRREGDTDSFKAPDGYRFGVEKERIEGKTTQVARVCWNRLSDGSVALDTDGFPRFVVYEWVDPRLYGVDYERLTGSWASWRIAPADAQPTTARPLLAFERSREGGDSVAEVIARIVATTGTAGDWYTDDTLVTPQYGLGGTPVLEVGSNDLGLDGVGDEHLGRFTDAESAGLGLAVPASMIAASMADTQGSIESALFDFSADPVYRCKAVAGEAVSARKLIADLLAPTGLCLSLAGGKIGLFDPWTFRAAVDTGNVTSEDYAGKPGEPESAIPGQTLRKLSPIDRVSLSARVDVTTGSYARTTIYNSTDPGAQYRAQTITRTVNGSHLVHPSLKVTGADWPSTFVERWRRGFKFWASQHFEMTFTVAASRAGEFWPGSIVSITDELVVNPIGIYGVAQAPGFVTSRVLDCKAATAQVTCIVSADAMVLYCNAAVVVRYDDNEDGEGYRLFCKDDAFGFRNGASFDVEGFVEPARSDVGGNALIEGWAFDGVTWIRGIYGTIDSINTDTPGSTYIKLTGALTGATYLRDQDHVFVLRNAVDQTTAWVSAVYATINEYSHWRSTTRSCSSIPPLVTVGSITRSTRLT